MNSTIIEEIVRWRMGAAYDTPIFDWRDRRLNFDNSAFLDIAIGAGITADDSGYQLHCPPNREGYDPARHKRLVDAADDMSKACALGADKLSAFLVMNDARLFPSIEYIGPRIDAICAQLSYARPARQEWRSRAEVVLWPLSDYIRPWRLPTFVPTPWHMRRPGLLWRGQCTGMCYWLGEEARPYLTGIRQWRCWLNIWLRDEVGDDAEAFVRWAGSYQRLIAVRQCLRLPDTDVRFVPMWDGDTRSIVRAEQHVGASLLSPRLSMADYMAKRQENKYILSIPGNDVPSSLRQDLLSGGLVLMPKPFWESVWFFGLKPNVHYIELRADMADLEERLQWCRDNDGLCREIAEAGRAFALAYFEPSLEFEVQSRLAQRLARQTLPPDAA